MKEDASLWEFAVHFEPALPSASSFTADPALKIPKS